MGTLEYAPYSKYLGGLAVPSLGSAAIEPGTVETQPTSNGKQGYFRAWVLEVWTRYGRYIYNYIHIHMYIYIYIYITHIRGTYCFTKLILVVDIGIPYLAGLPPDMLSLRKAICQPRLPFQLDHGYLSLFLLLKVTNF